MKQLKVWLVLALVFLAGFAGGVVATRVVVRQFVGKAIANPELVRNKIERDLNRKLRLDARQRKDVHQILVKSHRQLRELRQGFQPQFAAIVAGAKKDIAEILTPEQREQFERLQADNKAFLRTRESPVEPRSE